MKKSLLILLVIFGILSFMTSTVYAFSFSIGNPLEEFTFNFILPNQGYDGNGNQNLTGVDLTGFATFTEVSFSSEALRVQVYVENTSIVDPDTDPLLQAGIQKLAFGMSPQANTESIEDVDDGEFIGATLDISNELKIDTGAESFTDPGAGNRLLEGEFDEFFLNFTFTSPVESVNFDPARVKWQTGLGSFEDSNTPVPEPVIMLLLGFCLVGLAGASYKKFMIKS